MSVQKPPIVVGGQQIGRFKASWLLFKESFRFLRQDSEMIWLPLIATILNLFLFGLIFLGVVVVFMVGGDRFLNAEGEPSEWLAYAFLFFCYVAGAFTLALSQAGIAHIVYTRVKNGDATLGEGLKTAFSHSGSLFVWSLITSTVGLVLGIISEKSKLLGKIVAALLGAAWRIMTYFVVPAMVIDKQSAFSSIGTSVSVFKRTWGETVVSNVSIGLVFMVVHILVFLSFAGLFVLGFAVSSMPLVFVFLALFIIWIVLASLVQSALNGVLKTLLYIYASENIVPENFNPELLDAMLVRQNGAAVPPQSPVVPVQPGVVDEQFHPSQPSQQSQSFTDPNQQ